MFNVERAVETVLSTARSVLKPGRPNVEAVSLVDAGDRILREDIIADADSPPFDKSIRDGFAVRSEDLLNVPTILEVIGESRAGKGAAAAVTTGACIEIMTGALLPEGADAVVMVEYTERLDGGKVRILRSVQQGSGLQRQGTESRRGDCILHSGRRISLADIGLLAGAGKARVQVSRKPRVAIVATGDELVDLEHTPRPGQIRNSNSYTLHFQSRLAGAEPSLLGVAKDNLEDLRSKIRLALSYDIAIVSGGVSMGKYDLVEDVFAEFGVIVHFDKIAMKPGKPTVFGVRGDTFVFGLPGNPVSTIVSFHMFVRPLIHRLLDAQVSDPGLLTAKLAAPAKCDPERVAIVPAFVDFKDGAYHIQTAPWKGSSDLVGLARANALIVIPRREGALNPGEVVHFLFLE